MQNYVAVKADAKGGVLNEIGRTILALGLADTVLSYERGFDERDMIPAVLTSPQDAARIELGDTNPYGLARLASAYDGYLGDAQKIAVIGRACDIRALVELRKRYQVPEDTVLVNVYCPGSKDTRGEIRGSCRRCEHRLVPLADLNCTVGPESTMVTADSKVGQQIMDAAELDEGAAFDLPDVEAVAAAARAEQEKQFSELNAMSQSGRFGYWNEYFKRCIKCFGCRNACPICFCKDCYLDADRGLIRPGELAPELMFHLTRLAHVADSCLNCGQCDLACPAEIPISKLYQMLNKDLAVCFDYVPGLNLNPPPLSAI